MTESDCLLLSAMLAVELLKLLFGMLEDAEVLIESDNLSQVKAEYNIASSARSGISASGGSTGRSRKQNPWGRYSVLQVRALPPVQACICLRNYMLRDVLTVSAYAGGCACGCECGAYVLRRFGKCSYSL